MDTSKIYKFISTLLLSASAVIVVLLYLTWQGVREENAQIKLDESKLKYQLEHLSKENAYKEEYYNRLVNDDAFAERIIRERWGFITKGEMIFRFKDSTPVSVNAKAEPTPNTVRKSVAVEEVQAQEQTAQQQTSEPANDNLSILSRLFDDVSADKKINVDSNAQTSIISLKNSQVDEKEVSDSHTVQKVLPVNMSTPSAPVKNTSNNPNMITFD